MDQAPVYHPALVAAARRRCTALHLLRTAVPFRSRSVPAVVVAAAVAPFMPVAAFAGAAFASSVSVLDVKATVRPAHLYDRTSVTSAAQSLETVVMPPEDAASLRAGLERWRPLVALSLTTGRLSEVLPLRHVLGAYYAAGICRTLRSLRLAYFSATADDIRALASSCTVLQSLHVTPAVGHRSDIISAVLDSEWGSVGLTTLGLSVWLQRGAPPLTAADFKPRLDPLPMSPIVTVRTFTLNGVAYGSREHHRVAAVFLHLRVFSTSDYLDLYDGHEESLLHALTHGVIEGSTIEKVVSADSRRPCQTHIDAVVKARQLIHRWRRACRRAVFAKRLPPDAPTRTALGLAAYPNLQLFKSMPGGPHALP